MEDKKELLNLSRPITPEILEEARAIKLAKENEDAVKRLRREAEKRMVEPKHRRRC